MQYDYECQNEECQFLFEIEQRVSARRLRKCPACGKKKLERVILEAPFGFVQREPTTVGQLAERNTKEMGKYELQSKRKNQEDAKVAAKAEALKELKQKMPHGAYIPEQQEHRPWYGKLEAKKHKSIRDDSTGAKAHKYIMEGK